MPRYMDADNYNAQNLNAKSMIGSLAREMDLTTICYSEPDAGILRYTTPVRLWRWRFFALHIMVLYLSRGDLVFYPGHQWFDAWGVRLRKQFFPNSPIISTMEGIPWLTESEKKELEKKCGHKIYCMSYEATRYYRQVLDVADHVIAISPFLSKIGTYLYGDKFSVLPLGVDKNIFYVDPAVQKNETVTVVCSGTVYERKRPELFIRLAEAIPGVNFEWYGSGRGELLEKLQCEIEEKGLTNITFKGPVDHKTLAGVFRRADLFVLPSLSEGVPKVSQEAAACGLPLVLFGHYEAPTVIHGKNGYVVWDDDEFVETVSSIIKDRDKLRTMGERSAKMAKGWSWEEIAPRWTDALVKVLREEGTE